MVREKPQSKFPNRPLGKRKKMGREPRDQGDGRISTKKINEGDET